MARVMTTHAGPQEDPQDRVNDSGRAEAGSCEAADDAAWAG